MARSDPRRMLRGAALAVGVVWLPLIVLVGDLPHYVTFDDAWYYFQIGRNVADGAGSTFDGLHPTNGYHPLWLVLTAGFYLVGFDDLAAVRAILVAQLGLWVATLWLLADLTADAIAGWPGLRGRADADDGGRTGAALATALVFVLGANPYVFKLFVNGMETGIAALVGVLLLRLAARHDGDPFRAAVPTTLLVALVFLSRTDAIFLVAALFLWSAWLRRGIDRTLLVAGLVFGAVVVAYLAANIAIVGHPMQISGTVKRVGLDGSRGISALLAIGLAGLALLGATRARRPVLPDARAPRLPRSRAWLGTTGWWIVGALLLVAYEWGFTAEIYLWHYAPQVLWALLVLPLLLADIVEGTLLERPESDRRARTRATVAGGIVLLPFALGGLLQVVTFTDPEVVSMQRGDRRAGEWIAANLPADAVIGSSDAGVLGYFADRPVVNLDGLVNSYEWDEARREGTAATAAFLRDAGLTHLANHGDPEAGDNPGLRAFADELLGDDAGQAMELVHREEYVFAGSAGGRSGRRPYATFVYALEVG